MEKIVTKYVLLKVNYDSFIHEPPSTWDWGALLEVSGNESVSIVRISECDPVTANLT